MYNVRLLRIRRNAATEFSVLCHHPIGILTFGADIIDNIRGILCRPTKTVV